MTPGLLKRTIVVGDVQGCLVELEQLMAKVGYTQGVDRLILAGDLLDRGPDSVGVVRWAMRNGAEAVMGNHEESHIRFHIHERAAKLDETRSYKNPMRPRPEGSPHRIVYDSLGEAEWEWLCALPSYLHIDDTWTVVHAGCAPGVPIEEQTDRHLMRLRYMRRDGLKMATLDEEMTAATHAFWTELWDGPRSIVYGHHAEKSGVVMTVRSRGVPEVRTFPCVKWSVALPGDVATLGIDTGCCFGGRLTAAIFTEGRFDIESVPATGKWAEQHAEVRP